MIPFLFIYINKKLNSDQFIKESKEIHNNKYDYFLVDFISKDIKVKIKCPIHGVFEQIPRSHLKGHGCIKCAGVNKKTTIEITDEMKIIHNNKYDYSLVEYINAKTKVKIICKVHGIFEQSPNTHLSGHGCPNCYGNIKKDTDQFIKESNEIHGDKYDYSLVDYKNDKTKVKIICKEHGVFEQTPLKHIKKQGCPECANNQRKIILTKTTEQFIKESKEIHGNKYDYSLVQYKGSNKKVKIICKKHGIFEQSPVSNLQGGGCKKCADIIIGNKLRSNKEEFIKKSNIIHSNKYGYNKVVYKNNISKVIINCPIHGDFEQIPNSHLLGCGCPRCYYSKGELKIKQFLDDKNFIYKEQYKFNDCRNILPLPFDFYLPKLNLCIEYDGEQHFKNYRFDKNNDRLENTQKLDSIKTEYCKDKNIKLLRIKYTDIKNIYSILNTCLIN